MNFNSTEEMLALLNQEDTFNNEKWLIPESELDDDQYRVLNRIDNDFIVNGCAGSGKTILAIYRLKNIIKENKGSYLFIVYTIALKEFIKSALEDENEDLKNINVFYKSEFERKVKNNELNNKKYDYVIIDEVQDLEIDFINELNELCTKQIICLGDDAQQIYTKINKGVNLREIARKINVKGSEIEYLDKNYRVSKSIAEFAGMIIDDNGKLKKSCINDYGISPVIKKFDSIEDELDYIAEYIENEAILDVAILVEKNLLINPIVQYLREKDLEIEYKDKKNYNINFRTNAVKILTYHSSKGLEFENVFLPHCEIQSEDYNYREALYVACTRAKKRLIITYTEKLSPFMKSITREEI